MHLLALLALAVGPALILMHAVYFLDRYEKEPLRNLAKYLVGGALMCVPAFFLERGVSKIAGKDWTQIESNPLVFIAVVFGGIALVEEGCKFWILRRFAKRDQEIDEPFDWIVYSVSISLGFATLENIMYVLNFGAAVGVARAFTAVPSHALTATLMGDRLARAALAGPRGSRKQLLLAVIEPALWHGFYDLCALGAHEAARAGMETASAVLASGLVVALVAEWFVAFRRVRKQQIISRELQVRGIAHRGGSRRPPILFGTRRPQ